jgi:hypothetical protein
VPAETSGARKQTHQKFWQDATVLCRILQEMPGIISAEN